MRERYGIGHSQAAAFMNMARKFGSEVPIIGTLSPTVMGLLAAPSADEVRDEVVAVKVLAKKPAPCGLPLLSHIFRRKHTGFLWYTVVVHVPSRHAPLTENLRSRQGKGIMLAMTIQPDLSPRDIAYRLGLSVDTIKKAIKLGVLPAHRVGARGDWRVTDADFRAWVAAGAPTRAAKKPAPEQEPTE